MPRTIILKDHVPLDALRIAREILNPKRRVRNARAVLGNCRCVSLIIIIGIFMASATIIGAVIVSYAIIGTAMRPFVFLSVVQFLREIGPKVILTMKYQNFRAPAINGKLGKHSLRLEEDWGISWGLSVFKMAVVLCRWPAEDETVD